MKKSIQEFEQLEIKNSVVSIKVLPHNIRNKDLPLLVIPMFFEITE